MLAVEVWRVPHRGTTDFLLNFKFQMTFQMQMQRYNRFYKLEFEYMIFWATSVWCPLSGASCLGSFQTRSDWTSTVSAEPWLKSYVFFWGGSHPSSDFFFPEDGCFLYIFDLNFAKLLDFFLLICGTLLLPWTWEVTSAHFLDPWCPFSRLHQPKVPARAPCRAWCLEANGKFGAVWGLYVNCVWWKIDFCAKNQPLWISLFLKLSFCSKDFVSNLWFLSWSFFISVEACPAVQSILKSLTSKLLTSLETFSAAVAVGESKSSIHNNFTSNNMSTKRQKRENTLTTKNDNEKKTPKKNEHLNISLFGHGFFQGRT